jgi:hypothetical protein
VHKVWQKHPYNKIKLFSAISINLVDELFTPNEILMYFSKYFVNKVTKGKYSLVVNE